MGRSVMPLLGEPGLPAKASKTPKPTTQSTGATRNSKVSTARFALVSLRNSQKIRQVSNSQPTVKNKTVAKKIATPPRSPTSARQTPGTDKNISEQITRLADFMSELPFVVAGRLRFPMQSAMCSTWSTKPGPIVTLTLRAL
jgi:hypothetical protein